jgi:hypothetical protein
MTGAPADARSISIDWANARIRVHNTIDRDESILVFRLSTNSCYLKVAIEPGLAVPVLQSHFGKRKFPAVQFNTDMADNKGEIKRFKLTDREDAGMSNLTDEDIRRIACSEWARWMDVYGYDTPSTLNNQQQMQIERRRCSVVSRRQQSAQLPHKRQLKSADAA